MTPIPLIVSIFAPLLNWLAGILHFTRPACNNLVIGSRGLRSAVSSLDTPAARSTGAEPGWGVNGPSASQLKIDPLPARRAMIRRLGEGGGNCNFRYFFSSDGSSAVESASAGDFFASMSCIHARICRAYFSP